MSVRCPEVRKLWALTQGGSIRGFFNALAQFHKAYMFKDCTMSMDYSYRLTRLFSDVEELQERQRKLERYINYLQGKKTKNLGSLEKKIADQEKQIEKLKERTELMTKDTLRLKEHVSKLTEVVEYLANKQKREERLENERQGI